MRDCGGNECVAGECDGSDVIDDGTTWNLMITNTEVPIRDGSDALWDLTGLPDVYIEVSVGLGTSLEEYGYTPTYDNQLSVTFSSMVVLEHIPTATLLSGLHFAWYDEDLVSFDDFMHESTATLDASDLNGQLHLHADGGFRVNYRLSPSN